MVPRGCCRLGTARPFEVHVLISNVGAQQVALIYGRTQAEQLAAISPTPGRGNGQKLRLRYIGRLEADKGVHTALEAINLIIWKHRRPLHSIFVARETHITKPAWKRTGS
jgi:hypothetical protein